MWFLRYVVKCVRSRRVLFFCEFIEAPFLERFLLRARAFSAQVVR